MMVIYEYQRFKRFQKFERFQKKYEEDERYREEEEEEIPPVKKILKNPYVKILEEEGNYSRWVTSVGYY